MLDPKALGDGAVTGDGELDDDDEVGDNDELRVDSEELWTVNGIGEEDDPSL